MPIGSIRLWDRRSPQSLAPEREVLAKEQVVAAQKRRVELPNLAVRVSFELINGRTFEATGFHLEHAGRLWLITCRHNVEAKVANFRGIHDLAGLQVIGEEPSPLGRRPVVGIRIAGVISDCVAIGRSPGEMRETPSFGAATRVPFSGALPHRVELPDPTYPPDVLTVESEGGLFIQGFELGSRQPATSRVVRVSTKGCSAPINGSTYLPAPGAGFIGGPVFTVKDRHVVLSGLTTHRLAAAFTSIRSRGRGGDVSLLAGGYCELAPLLWALERAGPGGSILEVPCSM